MNKRYMIIFALFLLFSPLSKVMANDENDNPIPEQHSSEINATVTTYNLQAGMGTDGKYDLDRIANTIRETGADIIGLEEVDVHWGDRSEYENTIKLLAEKLDMEYFFAPIYDLDPSVPGEPRQQFGVAVLSKYPISHAENHDITRLSTQDPDPEPELAPGFLEAQIDVDGAEVWFYVTHLDYRADPIVREMQVSDMLAIMSDHHYNILVGDMNASPDAEELAPLFYWFDDAWDKTQDQQLGYTFPTEDPIKRIDYVLTSPRMNVNDTFITLSQASDHLPVTADITLVRGNHSLTVEGVKVLVEAFKQQGEIYDQDTAHILNMHLTVVQYFEQQHMTEKAVKHLDNFNLLLDEQRDKNLISEDTYHTLHSDTAYLIDRWGAH
ncbi:endonuclease/exonuclease/phosphatase family metal-dependent hydrolase [Virgibacillus halotolerans]|uniref:endonuclease/exonuclease/phosphatase family protein n=1 Tax=Virgibacillus halotolerans TaxID=1071053 RepID=UPI001EF77FBC|nr:endonuclease/exonuclease/phosphatase family protein [Virgibacillus halotolerans]MBM7601920.1 endonuclease/exonuclease/phosphatase family metal-dependent hydrolase [Virgibacillus halotolerans]